MKKALLLLLVLVMSVSLIGCNADNTNSSASSEDELYKIGIEVAETMHEMVESEEYPSFFNSEDLSDIIDQVDDIDFGSPTSVYLIQVPETERIIAMFSKDKDLEAWNSLSDNLQEQLERRFPFGHIVASLNAASGSKAIAFSSIYTAVKKDEKIKTDETIIYLYVFENRVSIVVSFFTDGEASGQFLFSDNLQSSSGVRDVFEDYECKIKKLKVK